MISEGPSEELRIFVDASLVEVYRKGSVVTTLRDLVSEETWSLELPEGAAADLRELKLPA